MTAHRDAAAPLLRSPPFAGIDASVSRPAPVGDVERPDPRTIADMFGAIREARVGGGFWLPAATARSATVVARVRSVAEIDEIAAGLTATERAGAVWLVPSAGRSLARADGRTILASEIDPWSLLHDKLRLIAHGDDEWAALAHIAGAEVRWLSEGRFGGPGVGADDLHHRVVQALLGVGYRNPFTGEASTIDAAIAWLGDWRRTFDANRDIVAACGMAWWKRHEIARFLWKPGQTLRFFRSGRRALAHAARHRGAVAVWPSRVSPDMIEGARKAGVSLVRVEDGFVRSVGLGSNLVPPSSIAVDRLGIHYDPTRPSDLEALLAAGSLPPPLLARAKELRAVILTAGISKYGGDQDHAFPSRQPGRRLVLVPGQVEDDMSVRLGGAGLASNLELLRRARALEPEAEIWFRPHPDVDAGHRKGAVPDEEMLAHADRVVRGGAMARLLDMVDATHVLTSLTGFEALMRGLDVTCHGMPFYAGWGLTRDLAPVPARRGRRLSVDELVAAVLILYPRYLDPVTSLPCPPEILIRRLTDGSNHNRLGWISRVRQVQGQIAKRFS